MKDSAHRCMQAVSLRVGLHPVGWTTRFFPVPFPNKPIRKQRGQPMKTGRIQFQMESGKNNEMTRPETTHRPQTC